MAGLTTKEALKRMHTEVEAICREYGLIHGTPNEKRLRVAEDRAGYGSKDDGAMT